MRSHVAVIAIVVLALGGCADTPQPAGGGPSATVDGVEVQPVIDAFAATHRFTLDEHDRSAVDYLGLTLRQFGSNLVASNVQDSTRSSAAVFQERMAPDSTVPMVPLPDDIVDGVSTSGAVPAVGGQPTLWSYDLATDTSLSQLRQLYERDAVERGWRVVSDAIDVDEAEVAAAWGLEAEGTVVLVVADAASHAQVSILRVLIVSTASEDGEPT